jgi:hypothetical protein
LISKEQAKTIMQQYIDEHEKPGIPDAIIIDEYTQEEIFGWVFTWLSQEYYQTDDIRLAIPGICPMIVDRFDGSVHPTGTANSGAAIRKYRSEWVKKHPDIKSD